MVRVGSPAQRTVHDDGILAQGTRRDACGFKPANDGHDKRAIQHTLGCRSIAHTVRYTELSPQRFRTFWDD